MTNFLPASGDSRRRDARSGGHISLRRAAVALLVGGAIFGAIYGVAASLGVSSSTLGAGNSSVAACQSATLTPGYATAYDSTIPGYKVGVVTVGGLASTCYSKSFRITLVNSSNTSLGEVTGTTPSSGTSFTADFTSSNVSAASVTGVHVLLTG
jgi:uncharacterized membrane protein (UPF0136 family)